jgi:hypothetical protein
MKQAAESRMVLLRLWAGTICTERRRFRTLISVLFSLVYLLLESFCLFLVHKAEACQAILQLKRMKERAILIIVERVVDLLVPQHAATCGGYVHHLDPESVSN